MAEHGQFVLNNFLNRKRERASSSDQTENKSFPASSKRCGGGQNPGLLTPASVQLAQLQAQLTLHRLKLAQTAVGGNTAAAATVLNQVLSNVAMSQPLLNQLRTSGMVSTAHSQAGGTQLGPAFPPRAAAFPPQNSTLETLVGGGLGSLPGQSSSSAALNPFRGNFSLTPSQQTSLGLATGSMFPSDTDKRSQYGFLGTTASSIGSKSNSGQNVLHGNQPGFQRDLYGAGRPESQSGFIGEQNREGSKGGKPKEQLWQSAVSFSSSGKDDHIISNSGGTWATSGQSFHPRSSELYNPEEPTADRKYSPVGTPNFSSSSQGIVGYQQLQPGDVSLSGALKPLQPHQLNDFHGVIPSSLPHHCTICEKKVFNLTDWDHHVNGKLHLQNCSLYTESPMSGSVQFQAVSSGSLSSLNNSISFSSPNKDIPTGPNPVYLPSAPMRMQPLTGNGFTSPQTGSKRKSIFGRVVHICNLPDGSCTENDVINLGLPFGKVTNYILMRSTHQAFLEMAYMEAAQAMVQYYQLHPATINDQKLLIRMSKRYKELQLKKPGKDVEAIIQDINFQREREEIDYPQERPRSRSPVSRSLSPRSHSPSYTSCSSTHSPQGACRSEWTNVPALGPMGARWDWSPHGRWEDERDEACWRNGDRDRDGEGPPDDWPQDRRKPRPMAAERWSSRMVEERAEVRRGSREGYPRGSPLGHHSPYRSKEEDIYKKPHQHNEGKAKRREAEGHHRSRPAESDERNGHAKTSEDRKQMSPVRGRSRKSSPRQEIGKKEMESENQSETSQEQPLKEKAVSPHRRFKDTGGTESERGTASEAEEGEGDSESEEESWYPQNMEELVTVDEVGEEDDFIIEPDLPEPDLQETSDVQKVTLESPQTVDRQDTIKKSVKNDTAPEESVSLKPDLKEYAGETSSAHQQCWTPVSAASEEQCSDRSDALSLKAESIEPCSHTDAGLLQAPQKCVSNHEGGSKDRKSLDTPTSSETKRPAPVTTATGKELQHQDEHFGDIPVTDAHSTEHESPSSTDVHSPLWENDKTVREHSIPLGVEFVVPRSGFFCKLCGLFYASEETAKTSHCRSMVHYKNLQRYLSQLAAESLENTHTDLTTPGKPCLVPQAKENKSPAGEGVN
ncbi:hypothetical protein JZ751_018593 [Albula glossodonta]|uniref:RNA-binding protein 20 n=1 Tax=Albula glossodonta TaxID=121402 RepID=A0A8T2NNP5_9TELE|nr:hypothetical protein JZ751_018593 [Albula glossodonta]